MSAIRPAAGRLSWRLRLAAWRFRRERADYFAYLADLIEDTQGRRSLRDIFDSDARRHRPDSDRARLSRYWCEWFQHSGGDLHATWLDTLPRQDLVLVGAAQAGGAGSLPGALRDLAALARTTAQWRSAYLATAGAGLAALAVMAAMVLAVGLLTVPRLRHVFAAVPPAEHGGVVRGLFAFGDAVHAYWPLLAGGAPLAAGLLAWALPNLGGRLRRRLDGLPFWRLYRQLEGMRFLSLLALQLRQEGHAHALLRAAVTGQLRDARPWLRGHLELMLARIDEGVIGCDTLDTGLIDDALAWYMRDVDAARGLAAALQATHARIGQRALAQVAREARWLRWSALLGAVGVLVGLLFWHYAAIDALRRALVAFHGGP